MKYHDYLLNSLDSSFFIRSTTKDEVEKYIETLKSHKTNGCSNLPNKLFMQFKECLKIPLAKVSNLTFELRNSLKS